MIDQACTMCANDNLELACAFVQKTATEKAVIEIDKYLKSVSDLYTIFLLFFIREIIICIIYIFIWISNVFFIIILIFRNMIDVVYLEWKAVVIVIH